MRSFPIILFCLMFLLGCKRNNSSGELPDIYNYLTKEQLALTPYFINPEFDTLVFLSDKGDTLSFAKTKVDTSYYTYNGGWGPEDTQWIRNQIITAKYTSTRGLGKFEIIHKYSFPNDGYVIINFNGIKIYIDDYDFRWPEKRLNYDDSLEIGGRLYLKIIKYPNNADSSIFKVVLNSKYGLINYFSNSISYKLIKP